MGFERVYTVWDYYDGIRSGIAEYSGEPHYFHCKWNEDKDNYSDIFILTPVDDETLSLALEQWSIWVEWEQKFHQGQVSQSTHPGLPGQHPRYLELDTILHRRISPSFIHTKSAHATFRPLLNQANSTPGILRQVEVEWDTVS